LQSGFSKSNNPNAPPPCLDGSAPTRGCPEGSCETIWRAIRQPLARPCRRYFRIADSAILRNMRRIRRQIRDECLRKAKGFEECGKSFRLARDLRLPHDLTRCIHNASRRKPTWTA
jgi:hypothetical protein